MATYNGVQTAKVAANGNRSPGTQDGRVRVLSDSYVFSGNVFSASDFIKIGTLPKGARVVGAGIRSEDLGTTGGFSLGTEADPDGFVAALTCTTAAGDVKSSTTEAQLGQQLSVETDVLLDCTAATDAANGKTIFAWVEYVVQSVE
jgi:hypothetical protein